jgi:ATP-dependent RNA helicase SUPV3L1/SUV3
MTKSVRPRPADQSVRVVLGPTNTGKTHLAVERMLAHSSGIIGLPLRLLAREIYDRIVAIKGAASVALITGEEKIAPATARYFVCTVEAMPMDKDVAFLAVDEIQLCADPDRGHVFTDRLLRARGREETMFLGAATMRGILGDLLPGAEFITRPRFSELTFSAPRKLSRLPRRTAIVAFSTAEVYAIAEMVRRQRGGAAVVLGALSPRTRNAQVDLYQNGDVDYLVATDAIGMGLNMDIDHVAFAATSKFDGENIRALRPAEVGQIAGRAGRHMNSGTFGLLAEAAGGKEAGVFDEAMIDAVEQHRFKPVNTLLWRNADLDFSSPAALINSLEATPEDFHYRRGRDASDLVALRWIDRQTAADGTEIRGSALVRLLWDACQIPDFRKVSPQDHARLCLRVFEFLAAGDRLSDDWFDRQTKALERVDGTIDTLMQRIAYIRTWTYAANRPDWLADPVHWQERTRAIEDRLSDTLHERLRQRFVDRRTAVLMRELKRKESLMAVVQNDGRVMVEGHPIGSLEGFNFVPDETALAEDDKTLRHAADRVLAQEIANRATALAAADDATFSLELADRPTDARILWQGTAIARLTAGDSPLKPRVAMLPAPLLTGEPQREAEARLNRWLEDHLKVKLAPLFRLQTALEDPDCIAGLARGLAYQIVENLGTLPRERVAEDFRNVDKDGRRQMRSLGIWLGSASFYLPQILKPEPARLRLLLWATHHNANDLPAPPTPGLITIPTEKDAPAAFYEMLGFRAIGGLAVRLDMLERVGQGAREKWAEGAFALDPNLMSLVGTSGENFFKIMRHLGYRYREPNARERAACEARQKAAEEAKEEEAKEKAAEDATVQTAGNKTETSTVEAATVEATTAETQPAEPVTETAETSAAPESEDKAEAAQTLEENSTPQDDEAPQASDAPAEEKSAQKSEEKSDEEADPLKLFFRESPRRRRENHPPRKNQRPDNRRSDANGGPKGDTKDGPTDGKEGRKTAGPRKHGSARKQGGFQKHGHKQGHQQRTGKPRRPEIAPEDSPFAALAELKKAMTKK